MKRVRSKAIIKEEALKERIILFVFMYLIFVTFYFSVSTLAKYTGTVTGTGSTEVAQWSVSAVSNTNSTMNVVAENTTAEYEVTVTSTSDVGCTYSIVINNVPDDVTIELENSSITPTETITNNVRTIAFERCGHFNAGSSGTGVTHKLLIDATIGNNFQASTKQMNIEVVFVQDVMTSNP